MKYGLVVFKETENLGDDIQSFAAKCFLPRVDYYIEREEINQFCPEKKEIVKVILSGWYTHDTTSLPPSPFIEPLIISAHFTDQLKDKKPTYFDNLFLDYLRDNQPIGLRDDLIKKYLDEENINNYFSGCLTLTIKPFKNVKVEDKITLVDVDDEIVNKVKKTSDCEICIETHKIDKQKNLGLSWEERMQNVEKQLKKYQSSKLVITSRLHVALPCLALGVPILLIYDKDIKDVKNRLGKYTQFLNYIKKEDFLRNPDYNIKNKNNHIEYKNELITNVQNFVKRKIKKDITKENIELYKKYFVEQNKRSRLIINEEKRNYNLRINELESVYYKLQNVYNELQSNYNDLQNISTLRINELEHEYNKLQMINESNELESELARKAVLQKLEIIQNLCNEKQNLIIETEQLKQEINNIHNTKGYKLLLLFRKIIIKIKRIIKKILIISR